MYSYLVPVSGHLRSCPPTSIQLLSTNTTSDNNPPIMFVPIISEWVPRDRVGSGHETQRDDIDGKTEYDLFSYFGCVTGSDIDGCGSVVFLHQETCTSNYA